MAGFVENRMLELFLDDFAELVFCSGFVCCKGFRKTNLLDFLVIRSMAGLPEKQKQILCKGNSDFSDALCYKEPPEKIKIIL